MLCDKNAFQKGLRVFAFSFSYVSQSMTDIAKVCAPLSKSPPLIPGGCDRSPADQVLYALMLYLQSRGRLQYSVPTSKAQIPRPPTPPPVSCQVSIARCPAHVAVEWAASCRSICKGCNSQFSRGETKIIMSFVLQRYGEAGAAVTEQTEEDVDGCGAKSRVQTHNFSQERSTFRTSRAHDLLVALSWPNVLTIATSFLGHVKTSIARLIKYSLIPSLRTCLKELYIFLICSTCPDWLHSVFLLFASRIFPN